jgi:hypothetical protein
MINLSLLEKIVLDQARSFQAKEAGVARNIDFEQYLKIKHITVISGIRRCGKSTLLKQFSQRYPSFYYLNFDDERLLDFSVSDFQALMVVFQKFFPAKVILLDEIQNVPKWERFARRIFEEGYKIFLTGSNAKLLSSELATHLTGRYLKLELYPFSFIEFLSFHKFTYERFDSKMQAKAMGYFDKYMQAGGFPEFVIGSNKEILKQVYEDIIYRDLITRFKIRESKSFKQLVNYLFANFTGEISYNSIKNILGFKSATSVKNYIDFIQESYLAFEVFKYDHSLKKQYVSNKKIYVIDNGLRSAAAFFNSPDYGKFLENLVFLELKRREEEIYYYKEKYECDFVVKKGLKIKKAFQVCYDLVENNKKREIGGLEEAMKKFNLKSGTIITMNQEEEIKLAGGRRITVIPAWQWILEKN